MIEQKFISKLPAFIQKRLINNPALKKIIFNINWLTLEKIISMAIGIFVYSWIARFLEPKQFGMMNFASAFVALFTAITTLGLDNIVIRNIISNPDKTNEYLGSTLLLKLFGSILMVILSSIAISFLKPGDFLIHLLVYLIAFGYIFKSFDTIDLWFQSQILAKYSVYARSGSFLISSCCRVILIIVHAPLIAFIIMLTFELFIVALLLIVFYFIKGNVSIFQWKIKFNIMKTLLNDSWPLILSGLAVMIYMKIDQVMIGNMIGDFQVGIYSAAVKLSEIWYFIPMIITSSVFPSILNARKKDKNLYLRRIQLLYDGFTWMTILISLSITLLSPLIIKFLYGNNYIQASTVLSIHIWSSIFVFLGVASSQYLIAENFTKISFNRTIIGAIVNVVLNFILIPNMGIIGAALATFLSYGVSTFYVLIPKKSRRDGFNLLKSFNLIRILKELIQNEKIIW